MRTLLFTCVALAASTAAFAAPPAADWLTKSATFSNADVVNARGASMAPAILGVVPETLGAQDVIVTLVDKQGLTQVEIVCSSAAIYELQNGSEFTRRSSLGTLHAAVVGALVGEPTGDAPAKKGGAFGRVELPASAGEKLVGEFVKSREATDVVVTIGWNAKEGPSVYGTLYSDRIELNPDAPKAAKK